MPRLLPKPSLQQWPPESLPQSNLCLPSFQTTHHTPNKDKFSLMISETFGEKSILPFHLVLNIKLHIFSPTVRFLHLYRKKKPHCIEKKCGSWGALWRNWTLTTPLHVEFFEIRYLIDHYLEKSVPIYLSVTRVTIIFFFDILSTQFYLAVVALHLSDCSC